MNQHQEQRLDSSSEVAEVSEELRRNYVRRRLEDLTQVESALKTQNFDVLKQVGHKIRGNAASFSYPDLEQLAIGLEAAAHSGDFIKAFEIGREFRKWLVGEMCRPWFLLPTVSSSVF